MQKKSNNTDIKRDKRGGESVSSNAQGGPIVAFFLGSRAAVNGTERDGGRGGSGGSLKYPQLFLVFWCEFRTRSHIFIPPNLSNVLMKTRSCGPQFKYKNSHEPLTVR